MSEDRQGTEPVEPPSSGGRGPAAATGPLRAPGSWARGPGVSRSRRVRALAVLASGLAAGAAQAAAPRPLGAVTLVVSGSLSGEVVPCPCTEGKRGGLGRRASLVSEIRREVGDAALVLDSGDAHLHSQRLDAAGWRRAGARAEAIREAYVRIGVDALTPGELDLGLGLVRLQGLYQGRGPALLAANLSRRGQRPLPGRRHFQRGGLDVAVVGVCSRYLVLAPGSNPGLSFQPEEPAIVREVQWARREGADLVVVLSHRGLSDDLASSARVPGVDLVVAGHSRELLHQPRVEAGAPVVAAGARGRFLARVDLEVRALDAGPVLAAADPAAASARVTYRYQVLPLDAHIPTDPEVHALVQEYADDIRPDP